MLLFKDLGEEAQNGKALEKETRSRRSQPEGKRAVTKVPSLLFDIEVYHLRVAGGALRDFTTIAVTSIPHRARGMPIGVSIADTRQKLRA